MLTRRSFLIGAGGLTLSQILSGCGSPANAFKILFLRSSIPIQSIRRFRRELRKQANQIVFKTEPKLEPILNLLEDKAKKTNLKEASLLPGTGNDRALDIDIVTIGDYWLKSAIENNLIRPLELEKLSGWPNLPSSCKNLLGRDRDGKLNENGSIWAAPYRWGTTVIAYRQDKLAELGIEKITDWSDLWQEKLRDRISLLNQPRQVIGLTLKKLGHSLNTENLAGIPELKSELLKLHQQTKLYDSINYLQPLILGDTWLAVGWSSDILPILKTSAQIKAIIPRSGTSLWADLWVKSKFSTKDTKQTASNAWIDFCWQPQTASEISILTNAASPIVFNLDRTKLDRGIRNNPLLLPDKSIIAKSEFIEPLSDAAEKQYLDLWQEVRSQTN